MNNTRISQAASLLNVSTVTVVSSYRDVAFALAYEFNWNCADIIKFVRECLLLRNPEIKGRNQYLLAVDIIRDEGIAGI